MSFMPESQYAVEMKGIVRRFPGVLANDNIDFNLRTGEIHALLGENGAGKSTLMNILTGLYRPDEGGISVNGQRVYFNSPKDAINAGIGMVHQHFMLVPSQSVTENILIGLDEPRFWLQLPKYEQKIKALEDQFNLKVDPQAKIWQLSVGEQQRVEILKMLYRGVSVLIMDEPTAVLAPQEIEGLFKTLRVMAAEGKSIVFISHKLNEVLEIADRITVLRRGKVTAVGIKASETNRAELAHLMVGRKVLFELEKKEQEPGKRVLSIEDIHALNNRRLPALRGVSMHVCAGEIVGVAAIAGNGQSELAEVITGLRECTAGRVLIGENEVQNRSARVSIDAGAAHIPEDRTHVGSAPNLSVTDNLIMKSYRRSPISHGMSINQSVAQEQAESLKDEYDIIVPTIKTPVRLLSGGNLQRVILAREISAEPELMIAVQPTRGLDVGAIEGVQQLLLDQREAGAAILLISEELEELVVLSDRIYVLYEGKVMGEVQNGDIDTIGQMMTGTRQEEISTEAKR
ncbi:MAG: ABC transporter ATP-binding protein [Anaerolineae bacterium]|nr:ABC transporter ATP-binding protein [Anaerolineae bacterium]